MIRDEVKATGQVLVEFLNESDEVTARQVLTNMVVSSGRTFLAQLLANEDVAAMDYMAMGGSPFATKDTHAALVSELSRVTLTSRTRNGNQTTFVANFPPDGADRYVGEFGIFNNSSGGAMLARVYSSPAVLKSPATSLRVTWVITFS